MPTDATSRNRLFAVAALCACLALTACNDRQSELAVQKLKDWFNSIKPESMLLRGLTRGVSTEAQIRDQMGRPETERDYPDGRKRLEYPRGPAGLHTFMVDIGPDGRLKAITQVLTAANFAKIHAGMSEDEVRELLGKPTGIAVYPLKPETVWSWHWFEGGVNQDAYFNVHFAPDGLVYTTSRSDVIRGH
ncbi:outer membrane protein assembly factor BamE [Trinickia terrae]|uniref:Outer membrane protein assembly factor BamE n=1 Tax=Trinickia terrae TaxID=2571161 RepID=A0A4U1I0W6_9BURK|nr:outer membrane protein assembly factor BamE [Trinickia terrae]TKC86783.1 outer membrane protein assembly factor BamE [Trinickia terrae]